MNIKTSSEEIRTWTTSRVALATVFVVSVFLMLWLLYRVRLVVFLLFAAIVIGTAIRPGVEWLRGRGVLRPLGTIIIYLLIAGLVVGFIAMIIPLLADQLTLLYQSLPQYYTGLRDWLLSSSNHLLYNMGLRIPSEPVFLIKSRPSSTQVFDQVTQSFVYANLVLRILFEIIAVFLLAYYWTQERKPIIRTLLSFVPTERRASTRDFLDLAETRIGGFIRGQGVLCLMVGTAAFLAYLVIGLPFALVLGIFAGFMEMIPILGPALGAIPASLVALSIDPGKVIWVLLASALIQMTENTLLVPNVMRNSVGINPILILLSIVAFGSVFGFLGALLALPLAAVIQLIIERAVLAPNVSEDGPPAEEDGLRSLMTESRQLTQAINDASNDGKSAIHQLPGETQQEVLAIARELDELLIQAKGEDQAA